MIKKYIKNYQKLDRETTSMLVHIAIICVLIASTYQLFCAFGFTVSAMAKAVGIELMVAMTLRSIHYTVERGGSTVKEYVGLSLFSAVSVLANMVFGYKTVKGVGFTHTTPLTVSHISNVDVVGHICVVLFSATLPIIIIVASLIEEQLAKSMLHEKKAKTKIREKVAQEKKAKTNKTVKVAKNYLGT